MVPVTHANKALQNFYAFSIIIRFFKIMKLKILIYFQNILNKIIQFLPHLINKPAIEKF